VRMSVHWVMTSSVRIHTQSCNLQGKRVLTSFNNTIHLQVTWKWIFTTVSFPRTIEFWYKIQKSSKYSFVQNSLTFCVNYLKLYRLVIPFWMNFKAFFALNNYIVIIHIMNGPILLIIVSLHCLVIHSTK
jgi:hypothetical protein